MATSNEDLRARLEELRAVKQRARLEELRKIRGASDSGIPGGHANVSPDSGAGAGNFLDKAKAVVEPAATVLSSIPAESLAGLAGIGTRNIFNLTPSADERISNINSIRDALTYAPRSEAGKQGLSNLADFVQPLTDFVSNTNNFLGDTALDATGSPGIATAAFSAPTAIVEGLGLKGLRGLQNASKARGAIGDRIQSGEADADLAGFQVNAKGKVKTDKLAKEAVKQGFDEGVLASVKAASKQDRLKMARMVTIVQRSKKNARFGVDNRPNDVAGRSLLDRVNHLQKINASAGKSLDKVANSLKGKSVDSSPAVSKFISELDGMGIKLDENLNPVFAGSDIEGLAGPQNAIKNIVKRMASGKPGQVPDAYDLHRMKKFIDENVTFGKSAEGLGGKTESILKSLRRDIDGILDMQFPRYNNVNTAYSETIKALDSFQSVAGKKTDLSGPNAHKATGVLLRRLMSNAQSRVNLMDSVDQLNQTSKKFGGQFNDDVTMQILFADELNRITRPTARTSLQGEVSKATERTVSGGVNQAGTNAVAEFAGRTVEKMRGINEDKALAVIRELLLR